MAVNLTAKQIVHYKMNDNAASTAVVDSSGNGRDGACSVNTNTITAAGKISTCLNLASSRRITVPATASVRGLAKASLCFWIKPPMTTGDNKGIFYESTSAGGNSRLLIYRDNTTSKITAFARDTASGAGFTATSTTTSFTSDVWYWICVTYNSDSNAMNLYVNNTLEGTDTTAKGVLHNSASADTVSIGYATATVTYINTEFDDFRLINDELSEEERNFIYNSGNGTEDVVSTTGRPLTMNKGWL